jgi:peptide/nickel transport system permease protein
MAPLILFGVMLITFALFFVVQTPEKMARRQLGEKAPPEAIQNWLKNRGYDKPLYFNGAEGKFFDSIFFDYLKSLTKLDLGRSDLTGEQISAVFKRGAIPSLMITLPAMVCGLFVSLGFSLFLVFFRESPIDKAGTLFCVLLMSIPYMFYMIAGQWLVALQLSWLPAFGFGTSVSGSLKFLILPILISVIAGLGAEVRLYRAIFLEEIHHDYIRTAQAKGVSSVRLLFTHVLKNGMINIITLVVASLPFLIMGSMLLENFFGIPGLGNLVINALRSMDFAVVRTATYLGAVMYLFGLLLTDICYAWADPRIRL